MSELAVKIENLVEDIVSCADEADGGKKDARRFALELIVAVREQSREAMAVKLRDVADDIECGAW